MKLYTLLSLLLATSLHAEPRTWTNLQGRTLTGELIAMDTATITIRSQEGKILTIQRSTLTEADQAFLKSTTPPAVREAKITFDEGGNTISQVTGNHAVFSGTCELEGALVTLSGTVSGKAKVSAGRWEIPVAPLDTWAKGSATITATAEMPGSKATASMTLNFINLLEEGAKGDGTTDDTAAILSAAKKAAAAENGIVFIPPGRKFAYKAMITLTGARLMGAGPSSCFLALDPLSSALTIKGKSPSVRNLGLACNLGTTKRQNKGWQTMLFLDHPEDFWVDAVTVENSPSAGILNYGGSGTPERHARITRCVVRDTLADAIHNTSSAHHVWIEGNLAERNGDDCFAVVSYGKQLCHDIVIVRNKGMNGKARGAAVVGGTDILIEWNEITNKTAAGIIVASEDSYKTNFVERVVVRNNRINGCPADLPAHGGIFVGGRADFRISDITIRDNYIDNSPAPGIHLGPHATRIRVEGNHIANSKSAGIFLRAAENVTITGNQINSSRTSGIFVASTAGGDCIITDNAFDEVSLNEQPENAVVRFEKNASLSRVEITGNRYKAGRTSVKEEIICPIKDALIKNNR